MEVEVVFLFILLITITYRQFKKKLKTNKQNIPGPYPFPILGNILQFIGVLPYKQLSKWATEYGKIYQIKIGTKLHVVISDAELLKQLFNDPDSSGRPLFDLFQIYNGKRLGIGTNDGPFCEVHMRFALRQLKYGKGFTPGLENSLLIELEKLMATFKTSPEIPISSRKIKSLVANATMAVIWTTLCAGHDFSSGIYLIEKFTNSLNEIAKIGLLAVAFPWLNLLCPSMIGYSAINNVKCEIGLFFQTVVNDRKKSLNATRIRDFIDSFLIKATESKPDTAFYGDIAEKQLVQFIWEIFLAAGGTTSTTFEWVVLYLCKYPEIQQKMRDEILSVTEGFRNVCLTDKPKLQYTLAVIEEVLRYSSIGPFIMPHRLLRNKTVSGYFVPKDTVILPNYYHIHHNPTIWTDPNRFRPSRFIDENGNFKLNENIMAFGTGKRHCIGENIGRNILFLCLANIYQKFAIEFDPNSKVPGIEPMLGFGLITYPFFVVIKAANVK